MQAHLEKTTGPAGTRHSVGPCEGTQQCDPAPQRKTAVHTAVDAPGEQREGRSPRLGFMPGAAGERKTFMKQVFWRLLHIGVTSPTPESGRHTSGLAHRSHYTLCCGPRCFGNLQAKRPARHKLLQVGSSPWWSRTDQDLGNVGPVAEPPRITQLCWGLASLRFTRLQPQQF